VFRSGGMPPRQVGALRGAWGVEGAQRPCPTCSTLDRGGGPRRRQVSSGGADNRLSDRLATGGPAYLPWDSGIEGRWGALTSEGPYGRI